MLEGEVDPCDNLQTVPTTSTGIASLTTSPAPVSTSKLCQGGRRGLHATPEEERKTLQQPSWIMQGRFCELRLASLEVGPRPTGLHADSFAFWFVN